MYRLKGYPIPSATVGIGPLHYQRIEHQLHIRLLLTDQDEYNPKQLTQIQWMIVWTAAWMTGLISESQDGSGSPRHHLQEIKTNK